MLSENHQKKKGNFICFLRIGGNSTYGAVPTHLGNGPKICVLKGNFIFLLRISEKSTDVRNFVQIFREWSENLRPELHFMFLLRIDEKSSDLWNIAHIIRD